MFVRFIGAWTVGLLLCVHAADPTPASRKIQPNDVIFIRVVGEADLTMERRVGADGTITYPYLEELRLKDKTPTEVERMIRDGLKGDYIVNPQVTVDFKEYVKEYVNVTGAVNQSGRIELPPDRQLDIMDVISMARDLSPKADVDFIQLTRQGQPVRILKYKEIRSISDPDKKIYIQPGDQIWVKERIL